MLRWDVHISSSVSSKRGWTVNNSLLHSSTSKPGLEFISVKWWVHEVLFTVFNLSGRTTTEKKWSRLYFTGCTTEKIKTKALSCTVSLLHNEDLFFVPKGTNLSFRGTTLFCKTSEGWKCIVSTLIIKKKKIQENIKTSLSSWLSRFPPNLKKS